MDFEQFKEAFIEEVKDKLHESGMDATVSVNQVNKLNESYEALTVTPEGSNVGVNLNMDNFFEAYERGTELDSITDKAVEVIQSGFENQPAIDVAALTDYSQMKDKLVMEVVSKEANEDMLANIPHKDMESMTVKEGLVIKYYYDCVKEDATTGNLSEDTLNEIAKKLAAGLSFSLDINGTEYEIIQNDDGTLGIKFTNATSEKVVIPDVIKVGDKVYRITEIHEKAFQNNTTLKEVELSANIQKVGDQAFKGCTSLEKVTMREGLVTIGNEAFKGCTSLKTIKTPSTLQTIGNNAFEGCTSLKKVTLNTGLLKIGNKAFYKCSNLTSVKIPKTVLKMGQYAFGSCKKLKKVTFAQTSQLLTMGKGIFSHCVVLKEIKLPNKLRNVPEKGFYNCKKLNKVTIGEKVTTISESAFEKCVKITSIKIPSKVQTIRKKAFYGCKSLKKVDIRSKALTSVGSKAFKGCKKGIKFAVPKAKMSSYKKLFKGKY